MLQAFGNQTFVIGQGGIQGHAFLGQLVERLFVLLDLGIGALRFQDAHPLLQLGDALGVLFFFFLCFGDILFQNFQILLPADALAFEEADRAPGDAVAAFDQSPAFGEQHERRFGQGTRCFILLCHEDILEQVAAQVAICRVCGYEIYSALGAGRQQHHRRLIVGKCVKDEEISLALLAFSQQRDSLVGFLQRLYDIVIKERFQVVFDSHPIPFRDVDEVGEQVGILFPGLLVIEEANAFGEALEVFDHALGQFELVAFGIQFAARAGHFSVESFQFALSLLQGGLAL